MPAQRAEKLLLQVDVNGQGNFQTLGGLTSNGVQGSLQPVETTTKETPGGFQTYGSGMGAIGMSFSGSFRSQGDNVLSKVNEAFLDRAALQWQMIRESGHRWRGPFLITQLNISGEGKQEETGEITLQSNGNVDYLAPGQA